MLSPGPANLVSLALAARYGGWRVLRFQAGVVTIYTATCVVLGVAAGQVSGDNASLGSVIQIAGGAFIVYLAVGMIRRAMTGPAAPQEETTPRDALKPPTYFSGVVLQCLNPKFPVVVLTILSASTGLHVAATCAIIVGCGIAGVLMYSTAGALVHRLATQPRQLRRLDLTAGLLLGAVGVWIAARGGFALLSGAGW